MNFASELLIDQIDGRNPDYQERINDWTILDLMNEGGLKLRRNAGQFLTRKFKEPGEIYQLRLNGIVHENILGPVLDWYRAKMANVHGEISLERDGKSIAGADGEWYANLLKDCERPNSKRRVAMKAFLADRFKDLLLYGAGYTLIDKPPAQPAATRFEQRASGLLDPYLVPVSPFELIDWSLSEDGELDYAVIRCDREERRFGEAPAMVAAWYVYTRENFAHYEAAIKDKTIDGKTARLISTGPHALTEARRVPIIPWYAQKGQWFADRAALSLLAHIDLINSNKWSMWNALLPMLVITGRFDGDAVRSEIAYLHLEGGDAKYLSPDPAVFSTAAESLRSLKEEAYRQMHVQAQARSESATAHAQSGLSKQEDMTAPTEILNGFGADVRDYAISLMDAVIAARGDEGIKPVINGWQFDAEPAADTLDAAERCEGLEIGSDTFAQEMRKRVVRTVLPDLPAGTLQVIDQEIEQAESQQERQQREAGAAASNLRRVAKPPQAPAMEDGTEDSAEDTGD